MNPFCCGCQARTAHRAALDSGAAGLPFGRMTSRGAPKRESNTDGGGLDIFVDAEFGACAVLPWRMHGALD